jgi:hypothetical protein
VHRADLVDSSAVSQTSLTQGKLSPILLRARGTSGSADEITSAPRVLFLEVENAVQGALNHGEGPRRGGGVAVVADDNIALLL